MIYCFRRAHEQLSQIIFYLDSLKIRCFPHRSIIFKIDLKNGLDFFHEITILICNLLAGILQEEFFASRKLGKILVSGAAYNYKS